MLRGGPNNIVKLWLMRFARRVLLHLSRKDREGRRVYWDATIQEEASNMRHSHHCPS